MEILYIAQLERNLRAESRQNALLRTQLQSYKELTQYLRAVVNAHIVPKTERYFPLPDRIQWVWENKCNLTMPQPKKVPKETQKPDVPECKKAKVPSENLIKLRQQWKTKFQAVLGELISKSLAELKLTKEVSTCDYVKNISSKVDELKDAEKRDERYQHLKEIRGYPKKQKRQRKYHIKLWKTKLQHVLAELLTPATTPTPEKSSKPKVHQVHKVPKIHKIRKVYEVKKVRKNQNRGRPRKMQKSYFSAPSPKKTAFTFFIKSTQTNAAEIANAAKAIITQHKALFMSGPLYSEYLSDLENIFQFIFSLIHRNKLQLKFKTQKKKLYVAKINADDIHTLGKLNITRVLAKNVTKNQNKTSITLKYHLKHFNVQTEVLLLIGVGFPGFNFSQATIRRLTVSGGINAEGRRTEIMKLGQSLACDHTAVVCPKCAIDYCPDACFVHDCAQAITDTNSRFTLIRQIGYSK